MSSRPHFSVSEFKTASHLSLGGFKPTLDRSDSLTKCTEDLFDLRVFPFVNLTVGEIADPKNCFDSPICAALGEFSELLSFLGSVWLRRFTHGCLDIARYRAQCGPIRVYIFANIESICDAILERIFIK